LERSSGKKHTHKERSIVFDGDPASASERSVSPESQASVFAELSPGQSTRRAFTDISKGMLQKTDDLRIRQVRPLIPPAILHEEIPISERASNVVAGSRAAIAKALKGHDPRLVVIAGPCSIHDPAAALDYAERLARLGSRYGDQLIVVMRTYFEKPRTSVGWKGLINDPDLDGSCDVGRGLVLARKLLLDINDLGLPTASEFLDIQIPQHIADLTSWVAIGARTTESQVHRELASGLSMPVGFKNSTDGTVNTAIDAVLAARSAHWFPSVTKQGVAAIFQTTGNDACHVILRGGKRSGPNFDATHVCDVSARLAREGLSERVMIDCSHGNSEKDHRRQPAVAASVCEQIQSGSNRIFGVMIESHLVEGRQDYVPGRPAVYGQSITDACISLDQTEKVLEQLAHAQQARNEHANR
jgi:3-deoxy-7-phosphoheptulonate synthase